MQQEKREKLSVIASELLSGCSLPESEKRLVVEAIGIELRVAYLEGRNDQAQDMINGLNQRENK